MSQSDFYSQRQALKAELSELNERRANLNSEINSYNSDVLRLRELGVQIDELNKSLDSLEGRNNGESSKSICLSAVRS